MKRIAWVRISLSFRTHSSGFFGGRGGGLSAEIQGTLEDSLPDSLTDSWSTAKDSWLFFGNGNKEMNIGSSRQWSHFK